jgi:hypothetical protein
MPSVLCCGIQITLSQPEDGVTAVIIYGGAKTGAVTSSGFLTVYLSQTTNFTAPGTSIACQGGIIGVVAGTAGAVACPDFLGTQYVTVYRKNPFGGSDYLVITELQVMTGSELADGR